jgi:hypothetical protein
VSRINQAELEEFCSDCYNAPDGWKTISNNALYAITRELIELRALRDGKAAFIPTVIGEAAQAGAVCDDTEAARLPFPVTGNTKYPYGTEDLESETLP